MPREFVDPRPSGASNARARLTALKDGRHAKTVSPDLPQENAIDLDGRINQWINDLKPRNHVEHEFVTRAAKLAWELDRAQRYENARPAHRVQMSFTVVRCWAVFPQAKIGAL
jgi:hypothetical protein